MRGRQRLAGFALAPRRARRRGRARTRRWRSRARRATRGCARAATIDWLDDARRTASGAPARAGTRARDDEAGRAGAAHPERVPSSLSARARSGRWRVSTSTWSPGSASGARRRVVRKVVGVGAVADCRRLLLEAHATARRRASTAAIERAHVAAGADLGGDRGDQPLLARRARAGSPRTTARPSRWRAIEATWIWCIANTIALDAAAPAELEAGRGDRLEARRRRRRAQRARRPTAPAPRAARRPPRWGSGPRDRRESAFGAATSAAMRRTALEQRRRRHRSQ